MSSRIEDSTSAIFAPAEFVRRDKPIFQSGAIKTLQKKRTEQDDVIERAPVKSNAAKVMEIWHLCLFYVLF